ncbi:unnamed protein product [Phyllotreta striolata]|uniref:LON peptidase N-terminal domain and RING finger protein 3 n=1 Tax=Phyllotreta striolata TaxID=444603 RepID=A0A9N9XKQ5_PHYSR|nr:unnamed protein product [Phyllotreta striolata]
MQQSDFGREHFLNKYPDLLTSLSGYSRSKFKNVGRVLRRDTARLRLLRKFKRSFKLRQFFQAMDHKPLLFTCPLCRNILITPITVDCGHTFCKDCLSSMDSEDFYRKCTVCCTELNLQKYNINVLVQHLLEKWRERNKSNIDTDMSVPNTEDILGIEPRYHLRSGYAGLQIKNENRIANYIHEPMDKLSRYKKDKRKQKTTNICNNSFQKFWIDDDTDNYQQFQETLDNVFKEVDDIKEDALKSSWDCIAATDLECILCSRCLLDPVTTGCGHTFCRGCLTRVLDHRLSCPLCMAPLNITDYSRGATEILQEAIRFLVPRDYNERMSISIKESLILERSSDIPVFICTNAFPGVACPLYVYEPRYRLLTRRCLQSPTKRFAMAGKDSGDKFVQYGTVLEVKDAVNLEDGRFILTTVGVRRFKVISRSEKDGYDTAKIHYIKDTDVPADKLQDLIQLNDRVYNKASKWIKSLKPKVLAEVERLIGKMPKVEKDWMILPDGPSWAWWLMPILPLSSQLQVGFLSTTSLEKRLRAIDKMLEHMKIRMRALERNTVACSQETDSMDSCGETGRSFELPFNNN